MNQMKEALNQANEVSTLVRQLTGGFGRNGLVLPISQRDLPKLVSDLRKAIDAYDHSIMQLGDIGLE